MNWKFWTTRKKKESKPKTIFQEWRDSIVFAVVVATLIRWSAVEAFVVPTGSMENTIMTGDFLFVSKFHYGSRTPATPLQLPLMHQKIWGTQIPSYLDWIELPTYRFPGTSKIKREDVIVFNVPPLSQNEGVEYPMDLKTFYVKRCVAIAGDRFEIRNKQAFANDMPLSNPENMKFEYQMLAKDEINKRNLADLEYFFLGRSPENLAVYEMFLTKKQFNEIEAAPYVLSIKENELGTTDPIYGSSINKHWNRDHYGPIVIPAKGIKIKIDASMLALYGEVIKDYEHNSNVTIQNNTLQIDGVDVTEYTFKQNYYFMMGDNRHNSIDSRYWGLVPEDHIVGKPLFVWLSVDSNADLLQKIRWDRIFNRIE